MEDPAAANRFMRDAAKVRKRDMINEVWINSLLSGPRTHVVNFVSNGLVALYTLPEQLLTAGVGAVLRTQNRATAREVGRRAVGMIQGAREGLHLAKRALVTGEPYDAVSKVEAANYEAIPGRLGKVIRTPTRFLTASDELWKAINRSGETHALAYRRALGAGGSAEQRFQKYRDLVLNPNGELMEKADAAARYYTFQKELGPGGRAIQSFANEVPLAKFVIPFVRTPINILKFAGQRSLLAPAMREVRDALRSGEVARDEALARITMGSGLSALAVMAALEGKISAGGPSDYREASSLRNSGWQPYSVKIGDRWVSYQRFEPLSLLAGVAADFAEVGNYATAEERESIGLALSMAVAKNITSKTWLSGLSDFFEMLSDPERHGRRFFERLAGSMAVPAVAAHAAGSMDPLVRDTSADSTDLFGFATSLLANIRNRIPVVSQGLPVRRNIWGEEMKRGDALGPDFISPVYASREERSPFLREVGRLRAPLSMPQRTLRIDGRTVRLTREQYDVYLQLSGKPARQYFEQFVRTPEWKQMDDDTKREFLKETMTEFRASARDGLKERYPELQATGKLPPIPKGYELPPLPPGFVLAK